MRGLRSPPPVLRKLSDLPRSGSTADAHRTDPALPLIAQGDSRPPRFRGRRCERQAADCGLGFLEFGLPYARSGAARTTETGLTVWT